MKKRVVISIIGEKNYWTKSATIWFWKSKTEYLNDTIIEFIKERGEQKIENIQMF